MNDLAPTKGTVVKVLDQPFGPSSSKLCIADLSAIANV